MDSSAHIPRNYVPGRGPSPARLMFVGEAPGPRENAAQQPFIGGAGMELGRYCRSANIDLSLVFITNLVKYWPPLDDRGKQLPPTRADIARDEPALWEELARVNPEIVVAIGAHAARYFLGAAFSSMRRDHGIPRRVMHFGREIVVVPCHHPAGGLHSMNQEDMARIQWDFIQVGMLMRGQLAAEREDEYPEPVYAELRDAENGAALLADLLAGATEISLDTEGTIAEPESVQLTVESGSGYLIRASEVECLATLNAHLTAPHSVITVIYHYAVHDIPVLAAMGIETDVIHARCCNRNGLLRLRDTMSELHLLGGTEPKGLKPAAWRACGMEMDSYEDVTRETEYANTRNYLERVFARTMCPCCLGTGKREPYKQTTGGADCACVGTGRVAGKRAGTTKQCACVKTTDKCRADGCVDGLLIPRPERELTFDSAKGEFRWKQPQSVAKWIVRRLSAEPLSADDDEENGATEDDDELGSSAPYFKLRKDWYQKLSASTRRMIEERAGKLPRTKLFDVPDRGRVIRYASRDTDATFRLAGALDERITGLGLDRVRAIDAALLPLLARMEREGMPIDRAHFEAFHADLQDWLGLEREKLSLLVGERNPNSKRMIDVLFKDLGLPAIKLTATGQESTDDETLGVLKAQLKARREAGERNVQLVDLGIEVIDCIQTYREYQKMDSTYVMALLQKADARDRIHTTLNYTSSVSRLSSEDPNLQNIPNPDNSPFGDDPIRNMGLRMRRGFIAPEGYKMISVDYSSIEMVVGAHLTQDRNLMRVFREGLDPHRYAASQLLGIPMDEVPKPVRTQCKTLNFAAFYDTSALTLQRQMSLMQPPIDKTEEECQQLINWYFTEFAPDVMEWKHRVRRDAQATGCVRTLFGRLRWIPGLRSEIKRVRSAAERECTNFPVQGTAGEILRIGSALLWEDVLPACWAEGIDAQPIMTVHDENLLLAPAEHAEVAAFMCAEAMKNAVMLSVPVKVGIGVGDNWADAH